jgi:hypothetical protein
MSCVCGHNEDEHLEAYWSEARPCLTCHGNCEGFEDE